MRVLILGGTAEARALAASAIDAGFDVVSSLAGRTSNPRLPAGEVRIGGFGGIDGLRRYLRDERIDLLVDATHPFADQISGNAVEAARAAGVPRVLLARPEWPERPGDRWTRVTSIGAAAAVLPALGRRIFLTIGRQELPTFAGLESGLWFLTRLIEPAAGVRLPPGEVVYGQGPFGEEDERALMLEHRIEVLVTRNSGGGTTSTKIDAARHLALPVLIIGRPAQTQGAIVESAGAALAWLRECRAGERAARPADVP